MAFCKACGTDVGGAAFCPKCGASQGAAAPVAATGATTSSDSPTAGMEENVAGLLCYLFGWISGLIFLLIDKRPFVKFHGAQAIALNIAFFVVWIGFWIVTMILGLITALMHFPIGFLMVFLFPVIVIGFIAIAIFCMYKAYQHEKFKLPIIGNMVEKMIGQ
ncbi:MAG TPA: DUF4870 domain-containing protein [Candidatus Dormibacteraeota bacterium]|jgi:uncharacterized membrane protein|nr:DUF4870 domain-containing protein [Candidatus Dormibacteraeota bacterium]